jgi:Transposase IS4
LATTLIERFRRPQPFYVLHLDDFFNTCKLYQELYERGIRANGAAKAGVDIPKELAYLRDAMTKEKDYGEWFNYVVGSINCIALCDSASKAMMTTVHDSTIEEHTYFDAVKRTGASLKYSKPSPATQAAESAKSTPFTQVVESTKAEATKTDYNRQLRKLYALHTYNQYMGGSDNHAKQNSYYSTAVHYHRRSWLPLFYFLLDAAITISYILYKIGFKGKKKLSYVEFQEEIARNLLRGPGAIVRQRPAQHPRASSNTHTKTVRKGTDKGHAWSKLESLQSTQKERAQRKPT